MTTPSHIVVVQLENQDFNTVIGNPAAPFLNELASEGMLFTNYDAVDHPSQPNYLALFSGSEQGLSGSDTVPTTLLTGATLASELAAAGLTFTGYAETGYDPDHTPWLDFANSVGDAANFSAFPTTAAGFANLPTVSFITPTNADNMTDSIAAGDAWLEANIAAYAAWAVANNSLLVITFDENGSDQNPNQIATIVVGAGVPAGTVNNTAANQYALLATIENMYGLPALGNSAGAPILDFYSGTPAPPAPSHVLIDGISDSGDYPPDNALAVGPANVVTAENAEFQWTNLQGTATETESLYGEPSGDDQYGFAPPINGLSSWEGSLQDSRIVYDAATQQYIFAAINFLGSASPETSSIVIGVSKDSNPADGWYFESFSSTLNNFNGVAQTVSEELSLAINGSDIDVTTDQNSNGSGGGFAGTAQFVLPVPSAPSSVSSTNNVYGGSIAAPLAGETSSSDGLAVVAAGTTGVSYYLGDTLGSSGALTLYLETGTTTSTGTTFSAPVAISAGTFTALNGSDMTAAQAGTSTKLDVLDTRIESPVYSNGYLYCTAEVEQTGSSTPNVEWFKIDAATGAIAAQGAISGATLGNSTLSTFTGSIGVNSAGDVLINFTASGSGMDPADYYTYLAAGSSTWSTPVQYQTSTGPYISGTSDEVWGDNSTVVADPNNPNSFWISSEFITNSATTGSVAIPAGDTNWWDTVTTQVTIPVAATPPTLGGAGATASYTQGGAAAPLDPGLTVADSGSTTLSGATVAIAAGFFAGDTLNFTNQGGVTGTYNATTGVLTLTGSASLAVYQTALDSVTFSSTSANPTDYGADLTRTIGWQVSDGTAQSAVATSTVSVVGVDQPPVLSGAGNTATYASGGAAVAIDKALTASDPDSLDLALATVTISSDFQSGDALNFTNQNGIAGAYNATTGVLTLSGAATVVQYQAALDTVTFSTTSANTASRTVTWQVSDGTKSSAAVTSTLAIGAAAPAAPTISSPASGSIDTTTTEPVISGTGVSGDTVSISIDGATVGTALVSNSAWSYTPTLPLSNASHIITATQAAPGGASSTAASDTFTVNVGGQTISTASGNLYLTSTSNPLTITSTGSVTSTGSSDAISAPSGTAWQINNAGTISGVAGTSSAGIYSPASGITVQNTGKIAGSVAGLWLTDGGAVTNGATGVISATGSYGIYVSGAAGLITNLGTITGASYAVDLTFSSASNRVVVAPGAVFNGTVSGGAGTLELATGASAGSITGLNTGSYTNFSALVVDAGANWTLSGSNTITSVTDDGSLDITGALPAATYQIGVAGGGGALEVASAPSTASPISFLGASKLTVDSAAAFGANVGSAGYTGPLLESFVSSDTVDIKGISATNAFYTYNSTTGLLQIVSGTQTASLAFQTSTLGSGSFNLASDGGTGLDVTLSQAPPPAAPTISSPLAGSTDTTTTEPLISGTGVSGDMVSVSIDGSVVGTALVSNSDWSYTPTTPLSNASHSVTATQAAAGGPSSATSTVDTFIVNVPLPTPPAPTISSPSSGSTDTTTTAPLISGTGVSGDTVTVRIDGSVVGTALVASGDWSFTPKSPLSNASHTISATQAAPGGPSSAAATDTFTVSVSGGLTISSATTGPLTLAANNNPVTITSAGSVTATASGADAIDGAAGTSWLINNSGAIASSQRYGVSFKGSGGSIANSGTISGYSGSTGYGVDFEDGGTITNTSTGLISGGEDAIFVYAAAGTINNSGTISSSFDDGIGLFAGGSVVNNAGGVITTPTSGGYGPAAIYIPTGSASVVNRGTISGQYGVYYEVAGSVENAGTISGTSYAVDFTASSSANKLIVDPGGVFDGNVYGGGGTMELTAGTGSIGLIGSSAFSDFTTLTDDAGAFWTLTGANTIANVVDNGTLSVAGSLDVSTAVNAASTDQFDLQSGGSLQVAADAATNSRIAFLGASELTIDSASLFGTGAGGSSYAGPLLEDFGSGDTIDLHGYSATAASLLYNSTSGLLQITNSAHQVATLDFQNSTLGTGVFGIASDGSGGVKITHS